MLAFGAQQDGRRPGNVIALNARQYRQPPQMRLAQHADLFANQRRGPGDVFWLKENAEFLNILEATGAGPQAQDALAVYEPVYARLDQRLAEYPQYYRFMLSLALDLEDLGMPGDKAAQMCRWAEAQDLPGAEMSDLQRAEARRLLARRGCGAADPALTMRLHRFMARSETFAVPNRKAAYELTHIVFYLSEYGRSDPGLSGEAIRSLKHAGLLAYLDQNFDLLAEVCIALRYAGHLPSSIWEGAVLRALRGVEVSPVALEQGFALAPDQYHDYFVSTWMAATAGDEVMPACLPGGCARLDLTPAMGNPLKVMSAALADTPGDDWETVRAHVTARMSEQELRLLEAAESSTHRFDRFYKLFARKARVLQ